MSTAPGRSEQVVEDFKQRKIAQSALRRVQDLLREFEADQVFDRRAARCGVIAAVLLVAVSVFLLFSGNSGVIG